MVRSEWVGNNMSSFLKIPLSVLDYLELLNSFLFNHPRSFHEDGLRIVNINNIKVLHPENIPGGENSFLLTINHYSHPGMGVWNGIFALSSLITFNINWIITSTLTFPNQNKGILLRPLSQVFLRKVAKVYGFIPMPPMPPDPSQVVERALAIRTVMSLVNKPNKPIIIGLSPEGQDFPGSCLGWPPSGSGRFILQLARKGLMIVPIGIYEEGNNLYLNFGEEYHLDKFSAISSRDTDREVSSLVMSHIAALLPQKMWGDFSPI
jgi:hypothetical protein